MRRKFNSLLATVLSMGTSESERTKSRNGSRRRTVQRRLAVELLEQRALLSGDGVFTRDFSGSLVFAEGTVVISGDPMNGQFSDDGNDPDMTFAGGSASDSYSSGSGRIMINAIHPTAAGDSTTFPQASADSFVAGTAGANTDVTIVGRGGSTGDYSIDTESIPDNPVFRTEFILKADVPIHAVSGDGQLEVASYHNVGVSFYGPGASASWYIDAQSIGLAEWYVTYSLPEGVLPYPSGTVISGGLNIDVVFDTAYDAHTGADIGAGVGYEYPHGRAIASAPASSSATFQINASTYASIRLVDGSSDQNPIPGGFDPPLPEFVAPKVKNVTLSHPGSTHPAYEFDDNVGSGVQLKTVPVGNVNQIAIQFTKDVVIDSNDLELIALNKVVNEPTPTLIQAPDQTSNGNTAIWSLSAPLPAAQYLLRLNSANVVDTTDAAFALDGEWTNPGSTSPTLTTTVFPSGDNVAGGDFEFVFTILPGDANRDAEVGVGDLGALSSHYSETITGRTWQDADFTGDGITYLGDLSALSSNYGKNWQNLIILGDYDGDFDIDATDVSTFDSYYGASNSAANLDGQNGVDPADDAAHDALFSFGIHLRVLT